jgi:hypothetical protein
MAKTTPTVNMQIGLEVIRSYRRLHYTPWYALAEFVDNSTQSYRDNDEVLDATYEREQTSLHVYISYDRDADILTIRDNAMGMSLAQLERALQIGRPPASTSGRSQFGLGLKTAACWFGDVWSVTTKRLGEKMAHHVVVDVEKVADGRQRLPYKALDAKATEHYTEIRIEKLHLKLLTTRLSKTKEMLRSMYQVDIRDKDLVLAWNNEILGWYEENPLLQREDGAGPEMQRIDFEVAGRKVRGWAGVLATGARTKAGFGIIRRGRLIRGWPDAWRPSLIFGAGNGRNDLINQRVRGELHMDAFDVTHTKDDINWQRDEEDQVQEQIREAIGGVLSRARTYRRPEEASMAPPLPPPDVWKLAITAVIENTDFGARARAAGTAFAAIVHDAHAAEVQKLVIGETVAAVAQEPSVIHLEMGSTSLRVIISTKLGPDAPFMAVDEVQGVWVLAISAIHPICALPDDVESLRIHLQHSLADGLVSWASRTGLLGTDSITSIFAKDVVLRFMSGAQA